MYLGLAVACLLLKEYLLCWLQVTALPGSGCRVQHRLSVQPSVAPPETFASYTKKIFVRQVERLLEDLSRELCRLQA